MIPATLSLDRTGNRLRVELDLGVLFAVLLAAVVVAGLAILAEAPGYDVMTETYLVD